MTEGSFEEKNLTNFTVCGFFVQLAVKIILHDKKISFPSNSPAYTSHKVSTFLMDIESIGVIGLDILCYCVLLYYGQMG